jgi:hypothetical protein
MPYYLAIADSPETRGHVYSKRLVTGQLVWYYRLRIGDHLSPLIHGPYLSAEDANKAAEESIEALA